MAIVVLRRSGARSLLLLSLAAAAMLRSFRRRGTPTLLAAAEAGPSARSQRRLLRPKKNCHRGSSPVGGGPLGSVKTALASSSSSSWGAAAFAARRHFVSSPPFRIRPASTAETYHLSVDGSAGFGGRLLPCRKHSLPRLRLAELSSSAAPDVGESVGEGNGGSVSDSDDSDGADARTDPPRPRKTVTILSRGDRHVVAAKPPSVVCHHSGWTGSRSKTKRGEEPEVPMLQRVRDALGGRRVNLIHRLDRGASGCLLFAYAEEEDAGAEDGDGSEGEVEGDGGESSTGKSGGNNATRCLIEAMSSPLATKTYVALVRGEGILRGEDLKQKGWFTVDRPIKDERGNLNDATTHFRFVAGRSEDVDLDRPRASIVLARPETGRWHQVRRHLNGLSHPILGDTSHGSSKVNREWKERRNMPGERTCLHLARLELPAAEGVAPEGVDVACPLPDDMRAMLDVHLPGLLEEARPILEKEGVLVDPPEENEFEVLPYEDPAATAKTAERAAAVAAARAVDSIPLKILSLGQHHVVAAKPPSVVCHHSAWTGKRSEVSRRMVEPTPMLQRVRDATGGRMVNLVHRLDRGASGCLVCAFLDDDGDGDDRGGEGDDDKVEEGGEVRATTTKKKKKTATGALVEAMRSPEAVKTYVALVKGNGTLRGSEGVNLAERGWFEVTTPVKDENGRVIEEARTDVLFVAGGGCGGDTDDTDDDDDDAAGLVLARPRTGRWHQIRQHLAGSAVRHPILGDTAHGLSRTNRRWREERTMPSERCCLHLARVTLPPTEYTQEGLDVKCPLPDDMMGMLERHMPGVLERARSALEEEGVELPRRDGA